MRRLRSFTFAILFALSLSLGSLQPAHALKNSTIIWRATGSGAVLGFGAGLVSYPFAKSKNTIVAGAVVGALLGAVYGYYLIGERDDAYRTSGLDTVNPRSDRPAFSSLSEVSHSRAPNGRERFSADEVFFPLPQIHF